jgi:hypothetical protein
MAPSERARGYWTASCPQKLGRTIRIRGARGCSPGLGTRNNACRAHHVGHSVEPGKLVQAAHDVGEHVRDEEPGRRLKRRPCMQARTRSLIVRTERSTSPTWLSGRWGGCLIGCIRTHGRRERRGLSGRAFGTDGWLRELRAGSSPWICRELGRWCGNRSLSISCGSTEILGRIGSWRTVYRCCGGRVWVPGWERR